jgi:hypothetical protein
MRAGLGLLVIANPPVQRIGELQAALKTGFVERLRCKRRVGLELAILALIPGLSNVAWRTASDLR